jgi:hypothetical protein
MQTMNLDLDAVDDRKVVILLATRTLDAPTQIRVLGRALTGAGYNVTSGQVVALQVAELY